MNNPTATIEELKATLDAWIPKYIRQVVELRSGNKLTAERYNELMNLLITQGDDTIELAQVVKQYVELLVDELSNNFVDTTENVTAIAEGAVDIAEGAVEDVIAYKESMDARLEEALEEVEDSLTAAEDVINNAAEIYDKVDEIDTTVKSFEGRTETVENSVESIKDGTTQVGNAKTLDGHGAEDFAKAEQVSGTKELTSSILEKALTLEAGVHEFMLAGGSYNGNDLPKVAYAYGNATVFVRQHAYALGVVLWGSSVSGGDTIALNQYDGSKWQGWNILTTTAYLIAELANYLPKSGGTVEINSFAGMRVKRNSNAEDSYAGIMFANNDGDLCGIASDGTGRLLRMSKHGGGEGVILHAGNMADYVLPKTGGTVNGNVRAISEIAEARHFVVGNSLRKLSLGVRADGSAYLYDDTNASTIINIPSDASKVKEFYGTASGNLPLTGGTVKNLTIGVNGSIGVPGFALLKSDGTIEGYIGRSYDALQMWDASFNVRTILDSGNYRNYALPKDGGGVVKSSDEVPIRMQSTGSENCYMRFVGMSGAKGKIGFYEGKPAVTLGTSDTASEILHTGNMAEHVLPKSGGELTASAREILTLTRTSGTLASIVFKGNGSKMGELGFDAVNRPVYINSENSIRELHHAGNSAKVHIGSTAPSDTSALWVY